MIRKLPNILSFSRVLVSPIFFFFFISSNPSLQVWSVFLFTFGAITDYFDGWIARKIKATTSWGKFFDPLADKFLTTAAFLAFATNDIIPFWMVVIIIIRDFGTTSLRLLNIQNRELTTSKTAKLKTLLQMVFIFVILTITSLLPNIFPSTAVFCNSIVNSVAIYLTMLIITLLTVWSLLEYLWQMFIKTE